MSEAKTQDDGAAARDLKIERLQRRAMVAIVLAIVLYAGFALFADVRDLASNLRGFAWWTFAVALGLSGINYAVRGVRWAYYLKLLSIDLAPRPSQLIFVSGFAFSVTPGKVGELLKSFFMRRDFGIPIAHSAPVVVGERLADFLALCALLLVGVFSYQFHTAALLATVGIVVAGTWVLASPALSLPIIRTIGRIRRLSGIAERLEAMAESMAALLRPGPLFIGLAMSIVSWGAECIGLWLILDGLGVEVTLQMATFVYASTTLLGAITMIPGGLGVTEASMVSAIMVLGGAARPEAVGATLLCRIATLWFAVAIGFVALWFYRRERASLDVAGGPATT